MRRIKIFVLIFVLLAGISSIQPQPTSSMANPACCLIEPTNSMLTITPTPACMTLNEVREFTFKFKNPCTGSGSIQYNPTWGTSTPNTLNAYILSPYSNGLVPNGQFFYVRVKVKLPLNAPTCQNFQFSFGIKFKCDTAPNPKIYYFKVPVCSDNETHTSNPVFNVNGPSNPSPSTCLNPNYTFPLIQTWTLKNLETNVNCNSIYYRFYTNTPRNVKFKLSTSNVWTGDTDPQYLIVAVQPGQTISVNIKFKAVDLAPTSNPPYYNFHYKIYKTFSYPSNPGSNSDLPTPPCVYYLFKRYKCQ